MAQPGVGTGAPLTIQRVAELVGGRVGAGPDVVIRGIRPVEEAGAEDLAFLSRKRYLRFLEGSAAAAYLVATDLDAHLPPSTPRVVVDEAHAALRTLLAHFHPRQEPRPSIHQTAVLGRGVSLGDDVAIGPYVVIEEGATIGSGSRIGAHCVIGRHATVGVGCHIYPHVVVYHECVIGARVILHAGVRIGADGFGYTFADGAHHKVPQVGRAVIEDDVEIGANSAVDRGSLGDTVVGKGVKIDNLVQVAHNVKVGALSLLAALVGVAGSTRLGRGVWLGGQAGVIDHLDIGDGARIATTSKVFRDVPAGETVSGHPARPHRDQLRSQALVARLPKLIERVTRLEARLSQIDPIGGSQPEP